MQVPNILILTATEIKEGALQDILPEYYQQQGVIENNTWHTHQDVLDHIIWVYEELLKLLSEYAEDKAIQNYLDTKIGDRSITELLLISCLFHDLGKRATHKVTGETQNCPGHELYGAVLSREYSARFSLDQEQALFVEEIVRYHGFASQILGLIEETDDFDKYATIFSDTVGQTALGLVLLLIADDRGCDLQENDLKIFETRAKIMSKLINYYTKGS